MIRLVYSSRTEQLVADLAVRLRAQQSSEPLAPVRLVLPNASMDGYVRLGVARACGIAANLDVAFLTRFAVEIVKPPQGAGVADADQLEAMGLTLLLDETAVGHRELAPVRAYLHGAGDAPDAIDLRRVQLAARVGRLFEEYGFSRADMLAAWSGGPTLDGRYAETERWQRRLWLAMFGEGGLARRRGLLPFHEAVGSFDVGAESPPVHVFGFSHFARTFRQLFERLGRAAEVTFYTLSPCEGFWEDSDPRDPALLGLWGRPAREHVRALDQIAHFDHDDRFADPLEGAPTLLHQLQRDLLRREPLRDSIDATFAFDQDESVLVLQHAGVRREAEAVASEIWRLVRQDATLRFDEIAVLVPESESSAYATHLPATFRAAHELPCQIVGIPRWTESRVGEAIDLLLALPLGRFTRQELLKLAVHPCVVASLDHVDPHRWLAWCDSLGILHGADRQDHEGTYIERDILNWDQGLRRLALGSFMAGDASGDRRPFELGGEAYVPYEVPASEMRDAAALGLLLRSLLADARFARDAKLPPRQWASLLCTIVEAYVTPTSGQEEEDLARSLRRLRAIGEVDLGERVVGYRIACELARASLAALEPARGGEGVVISTIAALRSIPFRVVFACGMGEGRFPSPESEDALDLRWAKRCEGDVTARDRDKHAFLELLLCARDKLYASYVSRDPLTGDELAPSSVVQELHHVLARGYVRDLSGLRRRHPLRRWSPCYFPELFAREVASLGTMNLPEARAEARTLALRESIEARGERVKPDDVLARAEGDAAWGPLAHHLRLARPPSVAPAAEAKVVVPVYALVKFLEFPLQGWARFRVGFDEREEDDVLAHEDEPFETAAREETILLRDVLMKAAAAGRRLEEAYDEMVRDRELRGLGPSGVFARGERGSHIETLERWRDELAAFHVRLDALEIHRFGRAGEHARADRVHDALVVDVDVVDAAGVQRVVRAEIGGRTLPLEAASGASVTLLRRTKEKKDDEWARAGRERAVLRAFVDHAVLAASGAVEPGAHASIVVVATPGGAVPERVALAPISRDEATTWLRGVVRDLLAGPHPYFLPYEAVFVHHLRGSADSMTSVLEEAKSKLGSSDEFATLRSANGPVPRPQDYPAPDEGSARAMVERRFEALFARRRESPR